MNPTNTKSAEEKTKETTSCARTFFQKIRNNTAATISRACGTKRA
jgi:hypothetical protein